MRKSNLVIATVTGLCVLGAALAMVLTPPTHVAEAQPIDRDLSVDTVTYIDIRDDSTLTPTSGTSILSVQGTLDGSASGINIYFDDTDEVSRWKINKCYNMANKALTKPGKYVVRLQCNEDCDTPSFLSCNIRPL